ncbi:Uma2 family endonuclease [Streptomyces piniterrae]|uniref:Uma2 family endonuclease n=1 Tax=Streptomyces piniterrae TaxID=2571125 RepID=A0A4U0MYK2_9ACTN|nr:Uma2 family endonuclease [Streptomyces piniterrae]TJZ46153.1 Uma2 family endonuclease [Streptomyces piniterrae]
MTALAHEVPAMTEMTESTPRPDLDEVLWQVWKAMELPEGLRAEIFEGFIEVSPTGRQSHSRICFLLRRQLTQYLTERSSAYAVTNDTNIVHGRKVWIPDALVAPEDAITAFADDTEFVAEDGVGLDVRCVGLVAEVVSPGHGCKERDRDRKRRAYARAGIPVYVIIDDYDGQGTVTVLAQPRPDKGIYAESHRVPYGKDVTIPDGPAKGFTITEAITGPLRSST